MIAYGFLHIFRKYQILFDEAVVIVTWQHSGMVCWTWYFDLKVRALHVITWWDIISGHDAIQWEVETMFHGGIWMLVVDNVVYEASWYVIGDLVSMPSGFFIVETGAEYNHQWLRITAVLCILHNIQSCPIIVVWTAAVLIFLYIIPIWDKNVVVSWNHQF